jgi:hypothetical protein
MNLLDAPIGENFTIKSDGIVVPQKKPPEWVLDEKLQLEIYPPFPEVSLMVSFTGDDVNWRSAAGVLVGAFTDLDCFFPCE